MSDAAITAIVTGTVTVLGQFIGFLIIWVKLKYGVDKAVEVSEKTDAVEAKLDDNTHITREAKEAANAMKAHSDACAADIARLTDLISDHAGRIASLEGQMSRMVSTVEITAKSIDSTRHEMRGHLQTVTNQLANIMLLVKGAPTPASEGNK